jgi:hypothetical protein
MPPKAQQFKSTNTHQVFNQDTLKIIKTTPIKSNAIQTTVSSGPIIIKTPNLPNTESVLKSQKIILPTSTQSTIISSDLPNTEKPKEDGAWINGGFFVLKPEVFNYLHDDADDIMWERQPLEDLAKDGQLGAYKLNDFWKCMDTLRDCLDLNEMWEENPEWKVWND